MRPDLQNPEIEVIPPTRKAGFLPRCPVRDELAVRPVELAEWQQSERSYFGIAPVRLRFGRCRACETFDRSNALMRRLDQSAARGTRITHAEISGRVLDPLALEAFNLYLEHCDGLRYFRRVCNDWKYRWGWEELVKRLSLLAPLPTLPAPTVAPVRQIPLPEIQ